ncbi:MAG: hypothetical protein WEA10_05080 [Actinomycetota bacterium]
MKRLCSPEVVACAAQPSTPTGPGICRLAASGIRVASGSSAMPTSASTDSPTFSVTKTFTQ